jgi:hypothetical protein
MKRQYFTPETETIRVATRYHLLDPSLTQAATADGLPDLTVGGTTTTADSRGTLWDDDE